MNKVILIGRLCSNPELRTTPAGKYVCEVNIAVDRRMAADGSKTADFVPLVFWGTSADSICKYGSKGQKIAIAGMLHIDQYEKEGQKRTRATVWVDQWEFCEPKRDTAPAGPDAAARYNAAVAVAEQLTPVAPEDELPF